MFHKVIFHVLKENLTDGLLWFISSNCIRRVLFFSWGSIKNNLTPVMIHMTSKLNPSFEFECMAVLKIEKLYILVLLAGLCKISKDPMRWIVSLYCFVFSLLCFVSNLEYYPDDVSIYLSYFSLDSWMYGELLKLNLQLCYICTRLYLVWCYVHGWITKVQWLCWKENLGSFYILNDKLT